MEHLMIKACHTTTSRRALLAGAPAVAATVLVTGTATGGLAGLATPVFAVLAEHRKIPQLWGDASDDEDDDLAGDFHELPPAVRRTVFRECARVSG
jgi:hypothetical protein